MITNYPESWDSDYRRVMMERDRLFRQVLRYRKALYLACNDSKGDVCSYLKRVDDCEREE